MGDWNPPRYQTKSHFYKKADTMGKMLLAAVLATVLSGCGGGDEQQPDNSLNLVSYEVSGIFTNSADLTYRNSSGGTEQKTVTLPHTIPTIGPYIFSPGDFLYISAQNRASSGTITVTIKLNGATFKQSTSSGAFAIATASGSCC